MMKMIWMVPIVIGLVTCIDPYEPNITKYENVMVVDGEITNLPGPYEVRLSTSFKFEESLSAPITGAMVKIIEDGGPEVLLHETSEGVYQTIDSSFRGTLDKRYKVQINYNNRVYASGFETLKEPVPIDKVYWELVKNRANTGEDAIQLYLDTYDPTNTTRYYAWEFDETWKFEVPVSTTRHPEWKTCYKTVSSYDFIISSTAQRANDKFEKYPFHFITEKTNRLRWRYSINVKQFALTEQAYQFYHKLIELNQSQGTLFDPVPYSLVGNIKNIDDEDDPVLGYFLVSGVSEKRIFIDRTELPEGFKPVTGFEFKCFSSSAFVIDTLIGIPEGASYRDIRYLPYDLSNIRLVNEVDSLFKLGYRVYDLVYYGPLFMGDTTNNIQLQMAFPFCYNCTLTGFNKVPDFWTEKGN